MALAKTLPIYKVCYDLLCGIEQFIRNMPRSVKKSVGDRMLDLALDLMELVYVANQARDKRPVLEQLLRKVQRMEILLRLSFDKRLISKPQYASSVQLVESIGKQATGWRNSSASPAT